jgi:hypothetical protein
LLSPRVCTSTQYKVAAKIPKAVAMARATIISVGIEYNSLASLGTEAGLDRGLSTYQRLNP